jgi:alpha-tubulin suppressor-like RCC1 family protein/sugar lactone lactonase YvrE
LADTAPTITTPPSSQTVAVGQNASFAVVADGTAPLSYQWYAGDQAIAGATSDHYTVANAQPADAASYVVAVSNSVGTVRSFTTFSSQFATGGSHSLFLKRDGTLWATGTNSYGQLADGSYATRYAPEKIAVGVRAVAAGYTHSLILRTDGTLWAAGNNSYGQLGDGTSVTRSTAVQIASGVAVVTAGGYHSLYLKTDGTLWGMGYNSYGQLGDGTTAYRYSPEQIASGVAAIAAGPYHSLFLKTDSTLWAFGMNSSGQLGDGSTASRYTPIQIATGVTAAAAGANHTVFLKADGNLWGMGSNYRGQLGADAGSSNQLNPVQIATGVTAAAAGANHTLVLKSDGTFWAMGSNYIGQLGDGTTTDRATPVQIADRVAAVTAGDDDSFYLRSDGTLWGMGKDSGGQLGDGSTVGRSLPIPVLCPGDSPGLLTVLAPPVITTQPLTQPVQANGAVTLSVTVSGSPPFTYQWSKDGVSIAGATTASYTLSQFSIAKAGAYSVVVANPASSVTSAPALVSLSLTLPASQAAVSGKSASLLAVTGGSGTITWQVSTDNGATWTNLTDGAVYTGTSSTMLEIEQATSAMSNNRYRYQVTGSGQTVTSSAASLNVFLSPLAMPSAIVVDKQGNLLVTDAAAQTVLKVGTDLKLSIVAGRTGVMGHTDGAGTGALFNEPAGFVLADDGSLVLADTGNNTIRAVSATGVVTTVAGSSGLTGAADGNGSAASFNAPVGMCADLVGIYVVADQANRLVRKVTAGGVVTTFAGQVGPPGFADGMGTAASFIDPAGLVIRRDSYNSIAWTGGNNGYGTIFVSDQGSNTIRTILATGQVGTYVGVPSSLGSTDGYRTNARLNKPTGLAMDGDGNLYIADTGNHTIRRVDTNGYVTTWAGVRTVSGLLDGPASQALFNAPEALAFDSARNLYVGDTGNSVIRKITPAGMVSTLLVQGNVPVIATQPASQTVSPASSVTFSVVANGEGALTYQWKKGGTVIPGATATSYSIGSVSTADAGDYAVVVTNAWGSTTSTAATLTVSAAPAPSTPPASGGGGGGGGGGALDPGWVVLLGALAGLRVWTRDLRPGSGRSSKAFHQGSKGSEESPLG